MSGFMGSREAFPFAPLGPDNEHLIVSLCGGTPTFIEGFRSFLAASGVNSIPFGWYRKYVSVLGEDCLEALDVTAPAASLSFNRGALLYAGTVRAVGAFQQLPVHSEVLRRALGTDRLNLAVNAEQAAHDIPTFDSLLDRFQGLLAHDAGQAGIAAARLGAGFLHMVTMASVDFIDGENLYGGDTDPTAWRAAILEDGHYKSDEPPEFADLKRLFAEAEWPDA